jgi:hemolysin III
MQNPVRGMLHGAAGVASLVGLALLWSTRPDPGGRLALAVFAGSLAALYTVSALYHSVDWRGSRRVLMQRLDHSMIYLVVAATYTPIGALVLEGGLQVATLALVWGLAAVGILLKLTGVAPATQLSVTLQTLMGWLALIPLPELLRRLGGEAVTLLLAGGLCYTVGMVIYATKRPRLFPRVFGYHEAFHVLVVVASALHFLTVLRYVAPHGL